jgi:hypothetical protein
MEQSPSWEANNHSASQQILRLSRNQKINYHVYKGPSPVPLLNQVHPLHTFPHYFPKIRFIIILSTTPRSSEWSLPFRFSDQNIVWISYFTHGGYMPLPFLRPWNYHPNNIWWSVQVVKLLIMQSSSASRHFLPLRFKYSPQHPVLKRPQSMLLP